MNNANTDLSEIIFLFWYRSAPYSMHQQGGVCGVGAGIGTESREATINYSQNKPIVQSMIVLIRDGSERERWF